jgi:hypothetical protein
MIRRAAVNWDTNDELIHELSVVTSALQLAFHLGMGKS